MSLTWHIPVVFLSGAAVLVLEILGTRVISPFFGATVYVWSALITVTLAALAAGYAGGGALADRPRPLASLCWALGTAGVWLLLLPLARRPVLLVFSGWGVQAGALGSAAVLFGPPLACLGAVGPLAIRLRTRDLGRLGREVGWINAVSTVGSVAGALAAGFFLIPRLPVGRLVAGLALLLLGLTAFCVRKLGGPRPGKAAALLLAAGLAGLGAERALARRPLPPGAVLREAARSFYGAVRVVDRPAGNRRVLYIDGISNTVVRLDDLDSVSDYIDSFELLPFLRPEAKRALMLGVGGGSFAMRLARHYGVVTDVVDVDPAVVDLARRWFGFVPPGEVHIEDGRRFLARSGRRYDLIIVDAFSGDSHPYHLFSRESYRLMKERLTPGGVLAINIIGYAYGPRAELRRAVERTLGAEFARVRVLAANRDIDVKTSFLNLTFLASDEPLEPRRDPAAARPAFAAYYKAVKNQFLPPDPGTGPLITDDRNPIETLSAPAFTAIRRQLWRYYGAILAD